MVETSLVSAPARRRRLLARSLRAPGGLIGLLLLVAVLLGASLAPVLAPGDPTRGRITERLRPPAWVAGGSQQHLLGTDHLGRDLFGRVLYGARISLLVAVLGVLVSGTLGVLLGLLAGYYGGWLDRIIMRLADIWLAVPLILLVISVVAILGPSLANIVVALGISGWVTYARIVRAQVLAMRHQEFLEATRALGMRDGRVLWRHVLPSVLPSIIVIASLSMAQMIILESLLSFLGLGVQPPNPTWGSMLADSRDYLTRAGWLATYPGLAILVTVLSINLLGDWLRDMLDPRILL